jgi:hypothetical protein
VTSFNTQPGPRIGILTVLLEAYTALRGGLPAQVAAINAWAAAQGSPYQIAEPDVIYCYLTYPKFVNAYPAIMLVPAETRFGIHAISAPHQDEYQVQRSWICDVLDTGDDWAEVTAKLGLWELVLMEILGDTDCLDCGHTTIQASSFTQPRLTSRTSGDLLQDLPLLFVTQTFEYTDPTDA